MTVRAPIRPLQRLNAIKEASLQLIAADKLEFTEKTPKKTDIARQFEITVMRPWTYTALELRSGEVVLKKVMTAAFAAARPGDGTFTKPMKFEELPGGWLAAGV